MRRWLPVLALLAATVTDAAAQTTELARTGAWRAYGGRSNDGTPLCGMMVQGRDRAMHIKFYGGDDRLTIQVFKDGWQIPRGHQVPVRLAVDNLNAWRARAVGQDGMIEFNIPRALVGEFEAAFRAGSGMRIEFLEGNEEPWRASLAGTNIITTTFVRCMGVVNEARRGPTQPFAATPRPPEPAANTQPFESRTPDSSNAGAPAPSNRPTLKN